MAGINMSRQITQLHIAHAMSSHANTLRTVTHLARNWGLGVFPATSPGETGALPH
jgi:hypothetical protein